MVGCGVGIRILKSDVEKIPQIRYNYQLIQEDYSPLPKDKRLDYTSLTFEDNHTARISVGDSKEGWCQALHEFLNLVSGSEYRLIDKIIINYDNVRARGERLKTFGGTAGGHEPLKNMFYKINRVIQSKRNEDGTNKFQLKPIDCLDIANIIGENVVVGGVRRTAEIALIDSDDSECINAKENLYKMVDGEWVIDKDLIHRTMSNNSIYFREKPTREKLHWMLEKMRYSGEPGWVNEEAGKKRNPDMEGVNPCGEVLLSSRSTCNLTTVNVMAFVEQKKNMDESYSYILNTEKLLEAQKMSARAAYRMTCVELELPRWDANLKKNRPLGCSLTGWQDMVNATKMSIEGQQELLEKLREAAHTAADNYADELKMSHSTLITTVKPEGTLSQLPGVSSGIHYSHSPYYVRRVRINSNDPLVKVCEDLKYPVFPEVGQDKDTCTTKVVEFPVYAPEGRTKNDVSAIEQLNNYLMFMKYYVDHNCSITIHVRDNEWKDVEDFVWDHWDEIVAVTFISYDDSFYQLLPYEAISKEEWEKRVSEMKPFIPSLISKYEKVETDYDVGQDGCEAGVCPVR
jgi:ribonucleoside-diphosphate reductase alpha chain/ribonucleoside-triphosphate reductase